MSEVLAWFLAHWELVGLIVFFSLSVALQGWEKVKATVYQLCLEAEKLMKEELLGSGPEKLQFVVEQLYELLPSQAKAAVKILAFLRGRTIEEFLQAIVQFLYDAMKESLEKDKVRILPA